MSKPTYAKRAASGLKNAINSKPPPLGKLPFRWRPDVYAHSFIPKAFVEINQSSATPVLTPFEDGINFENYVASLYGQSFLTPLPMSPLSDGSKPVESVARLGADNYEDYFQDCLALDLEAQVHEIRSFDLFGANLGYMNRAEMIFTLPVPGLREDSPMVNFGDTIMLRQWIESHNGPLQLSPQGWLPTSLDHPGFSGYEIRAVVVGVDKAADTLHIRAFGLFILPQIKCNVMFAKQNRVVQSLQVAVIDMANELRESPQVNGNHMKPPEIASTRPGLGPVGKKPQSPPTFPRRNDWLQRMLFPKEEYGILQEGLPSANFPQKWIDPTLNYEQKKSVDAVTTTNYGQLCYLINGPPGTGKTKTICEIVTQLGKHPDLPGSMLLCAPSNQAADTLAQRLSKHFGPSDMLRLNHFSRTFAEVPMELMLYCYVEANIFNIPPIASLMSYKIIIATCQDADILVQARVSNRDLFNLQRSMANTLFPRQKTPLPSAPLHWSALIIDEAAQATEPETIIPLSIVTPPTDIPLEIVQPIFVMAGDQYQLGPRTFDKLTSLHVSLFERLSNDPVYASHPLARKKIHFSNKNTAMYRPPFANLIRNYRSHPAILTVPSSLFYSNTLIPEAIDTRTVSHWENWSVSSHNWPVQFICNGGNDECEDIRDSTNGWYNKSEALKAINCAQDIIQNFDSRIQRDICIMSPFRAQVRLLRQIARERNLHDVNIGPMEAFQGLESQVVIICTTRARRRFLKDDEVRGAGVVGEPKKFNVAVTRAKEGLVVIGNPWVLATDASWLAFLRFCWRNGLWRQDPVLHTKMYGVEEGKVNDWTPGVEDTAAGVDPGGLEAALLYKEREHWQGSKAAKRFLGSSEDELWMSGVEAEEALEGFNNFNLE